MTGHYVLLLLTTLLLNSVLCQPPSHPMIKELDDVTFEADIAEHPFMLIYFYDPYGYLSLIYKIETRV